MFRSCAVNINWVKCAMDGFPYLQGELYCEGVRIGDLAEMYGTPLWIYSRAKLVHEYRVIREAFAAVDPVICYSVKANSNLSLLKVLNSEGSSFDIVGGGELYRIREAGADATRVIFAGVGKTDEEIRFALENDILMFNVESEAELQAQRTGGQSARRSASGIARHSYPFGVSNQHH
jgi:diaminopimelate decarboxylase